MPIGVSFGSAPVAPSGSTSYTYTITMSWTGNTNHYTSYSAWASAQTAEQIICATACPDAENGSSAKNFTLAADSNYTTVNGYVLFNGQYYYSSNTSIKTNAWDAVLNTPTSSMVTHNSATLNATVYAKVSVSTATAVLEYRKQGDVTWIQAGSSQSASGYGATAFSRDLTGLLSSTTYEVRSGITRTTNNSTTGNSSTATFTTSAPPAFTITSVNADSEISVGSGTAIIDLTTASGSMWSNPTSFTGTFDYRIKYATNSGLTSPSYTSSLTQASNGNETSVAFGSNITIDSLTPSTQYWYRVQTNDDGVTWDDSTSAVGTFTTAVYVAPPVADFTANTVTGIAPCIITFTDSSTGTPTAWGWGILDANSNPACCPAGGSSTAYTTHSNYFSLPGTYTVKLTVTNAGGVDTETKTNYVTVSPATVSATYNLAEQLVNFPTSRLKTITLTDLSTVNNTQDSIQQRLWTVTKPGTVTETYVGQVVTTTYGTQLADAGAYTVTLTATSGRGTSGTVSATNAFYVPYLPAKANFEALNSPSGPIPLTVTFSNQATGDGLALLWNFGDSATTTATTSTVSHVYTVASVYTVSMVATASSTTTAVDSNTFSRLGYVSAVASNYQEFLGAAFQDMQWHLLCPPDEDPCTAFEDFGGVSNVQDIYYRRLGMFLKETEVLQQEATLAADTAGVYPLPSDLIKLIRVEVDGQNVNPMEQRQADTFEGGWATNTSTDISGFIMKPEENLTLRLVPKATGRTIKVIYVAAPTIPSVPADCFSWPSLPLPYALSWAVKWGAIADILAQEGELNDPVRAAFAEEIYQLGATAARLLMNKNIGDQ